MPGPGGTSLPGEGDPDGFGTGPGASGRSILWVAILASFIAFLDGAIVNVALPAITTELGGGLATQQWVIDAYLLTLGSLILVAGATSDSFGRVRVLRLGLVIFGLASLVCTAAPDGAVLIAARAVQGAGAALLVPSSLALITATFSDPARAKAIGSWTAWTGTAFVAGPLLGGVLVDAQSWRWIFAINMLPIAAALLLLGRMRDPQLSERRPPVDFTGAVLAALGLAGPVFAFIEQDRFGWAHPAVIVPLTVGLACFAAFLWWEGHAAFPMMPLGLFRTRNFGLGNLATAFIYAGIPLGLLIVVLFLQEVEGFTASLAGLATTPVAVLSLLLFAGGAVSALGIRNPDVAAAVPDTATANCRDRAPAGGAFISTAGEAGRIAGDGRKHHRPWAG